MEIETLSLDHASYDASWLILILAAIVLIPGSITALVFTVRSLRRLRAVLLAATGALPKAGHEGVVVGIVERLEDDVEEAPFVRVAVRQRGFDQQGKNGVHRLWSADGPPRTTSRPFGLRLSSGELVRVEPGERVRLLDALDGTEIFGNLERVRFAALEAGEKAQVLGLVEERPAPGGGYRDAKKALALVEPASRETWIAGQDEILRVMKKRAVGYGLSTALFATALFLIASVSTRSFLGLCQRGQVIEAEITEVNIQTKLYKGQLRYSYHLFATPTSPLTTAQLTAEISETPVSEILGEPWERAAGTVKALPGRTTRFIVDRENPTIYALGSKPAMRAPNATAILALTFLSTLCFLGIWFALRPWWEKALVDERETL